MSVIALYVLWTLWISFEKNESPFILLVGSGGNIVAALFAMALLHYGLQWFPMYLKIAYFSILGVFTVIVLPYFLIDLFFTMVVNKHPHSHEVFMNATFLVMPIIFIVLLTLASCLLYMALIGRLIYLAAHYFL